MLTENQMLMMLTPAPVTTIIGDVVHVRVAEQERVVTMAMPLRYQPNVGDVLLIAATPDTAYAIGVVSGQGALELTTAGNLSLRAGGRIDLHGGTAIEAHTPHLRLAGERLELIARDLLATAQSCFQRIAGLLHLSAGRRHSQIDGGSVEHARQVVIKAQDTVTVDGSTIHLG
jgi:hypothetical protein